MDNIQCCFGSGQINKKRLEKKKKVYCITLLLMAVCFTLLFCGSSVLVGSLGKDSSVFYTIGRGIVQHKVAYKDLFDHKGLYLYFLNALGVLIADRLTLGLWLIETLFVIADVFLIFHISKKISCSDEMALFATAFTLLLASFYWDYWEGGNLTETYGLLPELVTFAFLQKAFESREDCPLSAREVFIVGICAGVELFLRANMVMAWIPIAVIVIGKELWEKRFQNAGMLTLYGILGVLAASVIPIYYCLKNDCLSEMVFASFLFNIRYVGNGPGLRLFFGQTFRIRFFLLAAGLGICSAAFVWRKGSRTGKQLFLSSFLFAVISVLLSRRLYRHYNLYLIPFTIPCLVHGVSFVRERLGRKGVLILLSLFTAVSAVMNSSYARAAVKNMIHYPGVNYSVRETIATKMEANYPAVHKVLVANGSAWYYARLDLVPEERYFYLPAVDYDVFPDAVDAQVEAILNGTTEAVVLEWTDPKEKLWLPNGERNEDVTAGLKKNYTEVFTAGDASLYIRNDIT